MIIGKIIIKTENISNVDEWGDIIIHLIKC